MRARFAHRLLVAGALMGYMKHVFGDDMNAEERERLDHAELIHTIACFSAQLVGRALRIYHDRFYGAPTACRWCDEPAAARRESALEQLDAAIRRPPAEPRSPADASHDVNLEIHQAIDAILTRRFGASRGFVVHLDYRIDASVANEMRDKP